MSHFATIRWVGLSVLLLSCRDPSLVSKNNPAEPRCGDGIANEDEACDGSDLKGATCPSLGFDEGSVACTSACQLTTVACAMRCGNGKIDSGESCDGKLGELTCPSWGFKTCSTTCSIDSQHCVTQPFQSAPNLDMLKGGSTVIADLVPKGYAELIMAVPTMGRLETFPYSTVQGLQAGRKLSFGDFPVFPAAGDLDGDGNIDLATIDADGKWIRYRYATDSNLFVRETTPAPPSGTTCASVFIVGQGKFNNDSAVDVATLACPSMTSPITFGALHVFLGGSTPSAPWVSTHGHIRDATVADVDRDGLLDVLFVTSQSPTLYILKSTGTALTESSNTELPFMPDKISAGDLDDDGDTDLVLVLNSTLKVMENTGLGFSENSSFDSNLPRALLLQDLDGDNRLDVAWLSGNKIQIRRNQGGFTFSSYELDTENSLAVSLSAGDLEGDGDMDLAATYNPLEQQTRTYVWVNKAY